MAFFFHNIKMKWRKRHENEKNTRVEIRGKGIMQSKTSEMAKEIEKDFGRV